jgi:hypothetical protein
VTPRGAGAAFAACRSASSICRRWIHAAGLGDGDVFGLNKRGNLNCGNLNLWGDGVTTGVGVGVGDAVLRVRFGFGEAAGDSASEADGVVSAGEMVWVMLRVGCLGGVGDSVGVPVSNCD